MNLFKQYFEEATDISKLCEIKDVTDEEMFERQEKAWSITRHWMHGGEAEYFMVLNNEGEYQMYDVEGNDLMPDQFEMEGYVNAVKKFDLINGLKGNAKETWRGILESLERGEDISNIKIDDIKLHVRGNITSSKTYWKEIYFTLNGTKYRVEFRAFEDGKPFHFKWEKPTPETPYKITKFYERYQDNKAGSWKKVGNEGSELHQRIVTELLKKESSYEIKKGLTGSAKDTWSDILESRYEDGSFDMAEDGDYIRLINDTTLCTAHFEELDVPFKAGTVFEVVYADEDDMACWYVLELKDGKPGSYVNRDKEYVISMGNDLPNIECIDKKVYETLYGLKGSAKETWTDILESRLNDTTIKVLRGPYGHIWRNQYDIKEHADECYDIEMWGCNIIWSQDQRWIVPEKDFRQWSRHFTEYKSLHGQTNIAGLIDKAIKHYNTIKGLQGTAKEAWRDILEFKDYFKK